MTVIDPRFMTVIEWTDRMALELDKVDQLIFRLDDPDDWRSWALNILDTPNFEGQNLPDPENYDDWQEWAQRFNQVVDL